MEGGNKFENLYRPVGSESDQRLQWNEFASPGGQQNDREDKKLVEQGEGHKCIYWEGRNRILFKEDKPGAESGASDMTGGSGDDDKRFQEQGRRMVVN